MGLFSRGNSGGLMNVIRCDEQEYMVWKWRPEGQDVNSTSRENAIRYGSSLRVKDGEVAVFVYKGQNGQMQDFIEGPLTIPSRQQTFLYWQALWEWPLAESRPSRQKCTSSTCKATTNYASRCLTLTCSILVCLTTACLWPLEEPSPSTLPTIVVLSS